MHTLQFFSVFAVLINTARLDKAEIEFEEYQDDYGTISNFYEDTSTRTATHPNEIPASLMKRLAEVESLEDLLPFIGNAVEVDIGGMKVIFANSSSDFELITRTAERSNVVRATPANCKPELHTVSLVESLSPSVYYWPTCTRIERCGGCCNSELLVCEPIKKETVLLEITKIEFQRGGRPMRLSGREVIPVEKHLSCKCGCKVKPSDCSEIQVYSVGDCKCNCRNIEAKRICDLDSEKIWDPSRCICFCRKERTCASGFYFDVTSCRCEQNVVRRQVDDTFSNQGTQLKGPFPWLDIIQNQEKLKRKQLHGEKEEKNKAKTTINLWKNRNDESLD